MNAYPKLNRYDLRPKAGGRPRRRPRAEPQRCKLQAAGLSLIVAACAACAANTSQHPPRYKSPASTLESKLLRLAQSGELSIPEAQRIRALAVIEARGGGLWMKSLAPEQMLGRTRYTEESGTAEQLALNDGTHPMLASYPDWRKHWLELTQQAENETAQVCASENDNGSINALTLATDWARLGIFVNVDAYRVTDLLLQHLAELCIADNNSPWTQKLRKDLQGFAEWVRTVRFDVGPGAFAGSERDLIFLKPLPTSSDGQSLRRAFPRLKWSDFEIIGLDGQRDCHDYCTPQPEPGQEIRRGYAREGTTRLVHGEFYNDADELPDGTKVLFGLIVANLSPSHWKAMNDTEAVEALLLRSSWLTDLRNLEDHEFDLLLRPTHSVIKRDGYWEQILSQQSPFVIRTRHLTNVMSKTHGIPLFAYIPGTLPGGRGAS